MTEQTPSASEEVRPSSQPEEGELEAEMKAMEASFAQIAKDAQAEIASLKQRLESAEEALDKFGKHDGLCARIGGYGYCNCGLEDALQEQEKQNG